MKNRAQAVCGCDVIIINVMITLLYKNERHHKTGFANILHNVAVLELSVSQSPRA